MAIFPQKQEYEVMLSSVQTIKVTAESEEDAINQAFAEVDRVTFIPEWEVEQVELA